MFQIALLKLPVRDVAASAEFYAGLFGAQPAVVVPDYGWAHFDLDGLTFALYVPGKGGGDRPCGGTADFHLSHPDLAALHARLARTTPDAALFDNDDGSRSLEFTDPDGNLLKIMQAPNSP